MSSEPDTCRWQDCSRPALWGSEFCFLHRPTGGDAISFTVSAVAKWAGSAAAGAVLIHLLKLLPHIGVIFNRHPDLITALTNQPDDDTLNRAISLLAQAERERHVSVEPGQIEIEPMEYLIETPLSPNFVLKERGKIVTAAREREIEDVH